MPSKPARWWIATVNNPSLSLIEIFNLLGCQYLIGQLERASSGTPHLQFTFWFKVGVRLSFLKRRLPTSHLEECKDPKSSIAYCQKLDTRISDPETYGTCPFKLNSKEDWDQIFKLAQQGDYDSIPKDIVIRHFSNLQKITSHYAQAVAQPGVRGIWIYGNPGVGKSHWARETYPGSYSKPPQNRWWDGYKGQQHVIIDDLDIQHSYAGAYLKNWLDHYSFVGEIKGGSTPINARWIVITSNYHPSKIFTDSLLLDAITRRLDKIWYMNESRELIDSRDL